MTWIEPIRIQFGIAESRRVKKSLAVSFSWVANRFDPDSTRITLDSVNVSAPQGSNWQTGLLMSGVSPSLVTKGYFPAANAGIVLDATTTDLVEVWVGFGRMLVLHAADYANRCAVRVKRGSLLSNSVRRKSHHAEGTPLRAAE